MKKFGILLVIVGFCLANADVSKVAVPFEGLYIPNHYQAPPSPSPKSTLIGVVGDTRSVLGPTTIGIAVSKNGEAIGIMYGPPSSPFNATQPFGEVRVAYSTDMGATFSNYGPFNAIAPLRRIYMGIDGCDNFDTQAGNLFFTWQEGPSGYATCHGYVAIEENIPSSPSPSSAIDIGNPVWSPCPLVDPADNTHFMVSYWSYPTAGLADTGNHIVHSTDGGYTWGSPILMAQDLGINMNSAHIRAGMNDYVFATYHDTYNGAEYPYYQESTDAGYTWSTPATLPALSAVQQWWHEYSCEVVTSLEGNNFPVTLHNDLDAAGSPMGLYLPDPDNPGGVGSWNWQAIDVHGYESASYQGTTYTATAIQYPSVCFQEDLNVILITYKCNFVIAPPPAGWTDGNYLGGIVSIDGGRSWRACRPLSGLLLQAVGGPCETAHQLVWTTPPYATYVEDTIWAFTTWCDAGDGASGNQYFELGAVMPVDLDNWVPGIAENGQTDIGSNLGLTVAPTIINNRCHISFNVITRGSVTLKLYDLSGRLVNNVFAGTMDKGDQSIDMSTSGLSSGVYIVHLTTPTGTDAAKLVINR